MLAIPEGGPIRISRSQAKALSTARSSGNDPGPDSHRVSSVSKQQQQNQQLQLVHLQQQLQQQLHQRLQQQQLLQQQKHGKQAKSKGRYRSDTLSLFSVLWLKKNIKRRKRDQRRKRENNRFQEFLPKKKTDLLKVTASQLMRPGLGILAADDSNRQLGERLKTINLSNTETNRRRYHEVLLGGESGDINMDQYFSGVLVREESLNDGFHRDRKVAAMVRDRNMMLGVRVDGPVVKLPGSVDEYVTEGLCSVEETCMRLRDKGVKFCLWRVVYRISDVTPSKLALSENSYTLSRFAAICQQCGMVPIVAPEVLGQGRHGYEDAQTILREILTTLMKLLSEHHVFLKGLLIRVSAAAPGPKFKGRFDFARVAAGTMKALNQSLPPAIGGVLLSRGCDLDRSLGVLTHVQNCPIRRPILVSFCYSLVIQENVASIWAGHDKNTPKARKELLKRAKLCSMAAMGQHNMTDKGVFFLTVEADY